MIPREVSIDVSQVREGRPRLSCVLQRCEVETVSPASISLLPPALFSPGLTRWTLGFLTVPHHLLPFQERTSQETCLSQAACLSLSSKFIHVCFFFSFCPHDYHLLPWQLSSFQINITLSSVPDSSAHKIDRIAYASSSVLPRAPTIPIPIMMDEPHVTPLPGPLVWGVTFSWRGRSLWWSWFSIPSWVIVWSELLFEHQCDLTHSVCVILFES